ncbi:MAG: Fe(3+) ABC transporter substrate-binding protein [Flavobacteriaceae bacterium CG_4_8_14_3_um_filter_34_10]|nr:Fe(3+) ABC transporter substrate-binding protein [Flavobacteriia bacterium]PIQ18530.1 MAG: Fe(3+) ABC transporter substrate-binding protein [Flavobacteriaceae bacterium CG18_big_fil_WC_8_21_14_2_50_34_36]PIV49816.1 MAG: Fe(3+) ABC transporter substrate-binding protein [Flavobacteriaceae bacterium CG02_land_8_20_14_3_00_34_13]PIX08777.1 MAG: Fe(3+) ABC transporter substrate-binding protein [Flavobacteriaceae bacterium CG_4_8_14_3_um_filter_34_10]PIZ07094.1 MAG: Fe(3+) ABC transporter substrat
MLKYILIMFGVLLLFSCKSEAKKEVSNEVNVYTHRHYESDQKLFNLFEEKTGIKVNVINASADELIQKMTLEGANSPADVLITVDAGRLHRAKENNLLQPINSEKLNEIIPFYLKDKENYWFGVTKRARIIVYAKDRVTPEELSTYEDLATEKWNKRVIVRSSGNIYNQSLMASILVNHDEAFAKEWSAGIVKNMARSPKGNDRDQVKAIFAGEGDVTIINTYYLGNMLDSDDSEEVKAANGVGIFFPNQESTGAHINVSGAGVAKYAPNKENAIRFIEFLVSEEAQKIFALSNHEYPVNKKVPMSETLKSWGVFKEDTLNLSLLGENNKKAVILLDETGWK